MGTTVAASAFVLLVACTASPSSSDVPGSRSRTPDAVTATSALSSPPSGRAIDMGSLDGRIVFSDETNDIWSIDADGSRVRRLTSAHAQEFDPTWSPDRKQIAYRHQVGDDHTTEIFVMDSDGSNATNLTNNHVPDWGPAWSPDGTEIVWNSAFGTGGFGFYGYVMAPNGTNVRRITRHYVEYPAWSPDGSRIAFMAQEPGAFGDNPDYNIFTMRSDGSDVHRLTTAPGSDGWPAWSPDGAHIAFSSTRDDCSISDAPDCRTTGDIGPWHDVWIMDADGSDQRRVASEFGQFFAWSPDGSVLLVAGADDMFVIHPDGTGETVLPVPGVAHPLFPDWTA